MGKGSPSTPAPPDPNQTARAQGNLSKETALWNAQLNAVDQFTPYGSLTWENTGTSRTFDQAGWDRAVARSMAGQSPWPDQNEFWRVEGTPKFTQRVNLTPQAQAILDSELRSNLALNQLGEEQLGRIRANVATPFSFSDLPPVFGDGDAMTAQQRAEEALLSRVAPQFDRDEESLRTRLQNQGVVPGSQAFQREMENLNQARTDARMQAVLKGQQYAQALLGDSLARRNQAIQEYTTERNAPLNEMSAFRSGTQIQNPQFNNVSLGGAQTPDLAGLIQQNYQAELQAANARNASRGNALGSLFSLGATLGGSFLGGPAAGSLFGAATKV